jgi:hypothetical protein
MSNNDIYNLAHTAHNVQVYEQNEHVSKKKPQHQIASCLAMTRVNKITPNFKHYPQYR